MLPNGVNGTLGATALDELGCNSRTDRRSHPECRSNSRPELPLCQFCSWGNDVGDFQACRDALRGSKHIPGAFGG